METHRGLERFVFGYWFYFLLLNIKRPKLLMRGRRDPIGMRAGPLIISEILHPSRIGLHWPEAASVWSSCAFTSIPKAAKLKPQAA
jgi:hypothetical protein